MQLAADGRFWPLVALAGLVLAVIVILNWSTVLTILSIIAAIVGTLLALLVVGLLFL